MRIGRPGQVGIDLFAADAFAFGLGAGQREGDLAGALPIAGQDRVILVGRQGRSEEPDISI
jgi:hypothetical protein